MDVKSMLLGFLMRGSMTGYELKKVFSISFSFFSGLSYGSIYPALKKMEQEGLMTMQLQIQDGAPNRKIYTITDAGKKAFIEALRAPFSFERTKSSFLTKLFFFHHYAMPGAIDLVESQIRLLKIRIEEMRERLKNEEAPYKKLVYDFKIHTVESHLSWLSTKARPFARGTHQELT